MRGSTCLVTGANDGIGKETAAGLAARGARVLMVSRRREAGMEAIRELRGRIPGALLELLQADLSTIGAVRALARQVIDRTDRLDVLVSNAGVFHGRRVETPDGLEATFAVNHLAPFVLINHLLDLLRRSHPARVAIVASDAHYRGTLRFEDLQMKRGYGGWRAYTRSKLANVLHAAELARRLPPGEVTVNSLHPGVVGTKLLLRGIVPRWLASPWTITPREGARTSVFLASDPELAGVTGLYFDECRPKAPSQEAADPEVAMRLWSASEEIIEHAGLKIPGE